MQWAQRSHTHTNRRTAVQSVCWFMPCLLVWSVRLLFLECKAVETHSSGWVGPSVCMCLRCTAFRMQGGRAGGGVHNTVYTPEPAGVSAVAQVHVQSVFVVCLCGECRADGLRV